MVAAATGPVTLWLATRTSLAVTLSLATRTSSAATGVGQAANAAGAKGDPLGKPRHAFTGNVVVSPLLSR